MAKYNKLHEQGTTWYRVTLPEFRELIDTDANPFIVKLIDDYGFDCLNLKEMYCSAVVNDVLYLAVTDGQKIEVNEEKVMPDVAFEKYAPSQLSEYIKPLNEDVLYSEITSYEIDIDRLSNKIQDYTYEFMRDGMPMSDIIKYIKEL